MNKQELQKKSYFGFHNHTAFSNARLLDAIMSPKTLIETAYRLGLKGVAITDHEILSAHVKAQKYLKEQQKLGRLTDFRLFFGNEIYLVDKETVQKAREENEKTRFFHFILIAKDKLGYDFLRKQSTKAWENNFWFRGLQRVPTYKDELKKMMEPYKDHVYASTACIGGEINQLSLKLFDECSEDDELNFEKIKTNKNFLKIKENLRYMKDVFGENNFYFELQPSPHKQQLIVNKMIIFYSKIFNIPYTITTDSHYATAADKPIHTTFLKSKNKDRDVEDFYATARLFGAKELSEYFNDEVLTNAFNLSYELASNIEDFDFYHQTIIPKSHIPEKYLNDTPLIKLRSVEMFVESLEKHGLNVKQYNYINKYLRATNSSDKYYIYLILNGLFNKVKNITDEHLSRIDIELEQIYEISNQIKQPMSAYFLAEIDFMKEMWKVSILGPARGSAACFYTNYLLGIVQVDALKYNLKWWRFLSKERVGDFPDIDLDAGSIHRKDVMQQLRNSYGANKIIKISTFSTIGDNAAIEAACRGLDIDTSISSNLKDLLQGDSVNDALFGNEKKNIKPNEQFCSIVNKYPMLKETIVGLLGIVTGVSEHASGMLCLNDSDEGWVKHNAMMTTTSGLPVTQLDAHDSEYCGGIKYDMLSISALSRIEFAMKALIENHEIKNQGSIKATYEKYFQPDSLNFTNDKIYELFSNNSIPELFQFSTKVGFGVLKKLKAKSFNQTASANSLMRLTVEDGEQPVDKYIRFRDNEGAWDKEMIDFGLSDEERKVLHSELDSEFGICVTQEELMSLAMNKKVGNYNLLEANKLRKAVAKKDHKLQDAQKKAFFEKGKSIGTSEKMLEYVWEYCFKIQFAYSFNGAHVVSYTLISFIEANICARYGIEYWVVGCLEYDSGVWNDDSKNNKVKFPQAVSKFIHHVKQPSINKSGVGFKVIDGKILFGLGVIGGIKNEDIELIENNRPYNNFDDINSKIFKVLDEKKSINLIKSGVFDEIIKDRQKLMMRYIASTIKERKSVSIVSVPNLGPIIPKKFELSLKLQTLKKMFVGKRKQKMTDAQSKVLSQHFGNSIITFNSSGAPELNQEVFEKLYDDNMVDFKKWLKTKDAIKAQKSYLAYEKYIKKCYGSIYQWELDVMGCFVTNSVIAPIKKDISIRFGIRNILDLENGSFKGKKYNIVGTIVDYKNNGTLSVIDDSLNIVFVRIGKNAYQSLNEKITKGKGKNKEIIKPSWIVRGNTLLFTGFRRDDEFCAYGIKNTGLIKFNSNGTKYKVERLDE